MKDLLAPQFSWYFFILATIVLVSIYLLLQLLPKYISKVPLGHISQSRINNVLRRVVLFYEPLFLLLISSIFLLVNPIWHGSLLLFFIVTCFPLIRNYLYGKFLQYDDSFHRGKGIIIGTMRGDINRMNGLGIYIMTAQGVQYFSYTHIQQEGFSLVADNDTREYCYLNIENKKNKTEQVDATFLMYKIMQVPYLDSNFQPVLTNQDKVEKMQIKVLLKPGNHRKEILDLVENWGYQCSLSH